MNVNSGGFFGGVFPVSKHNFEHFYQRKPLQNDGLLMMSGYSYFDHDRGCTCVYNIQGKLFAASNKVLAALQARHVQLKRTTPPRTFGLDDDGDGGNQPLFTF